MKTWITVVCSLLIFSGALFAQDSGEKPIEKLPNVFDLGLPGVKLNLDGDSFTPLGTQSGPVFTSSLEAPENPKAGDVVTLKLSVKVAEGSYTYSQSDSFSGKTTIKLEDVQGVIPVDPGFKPDHPAKKEFDPTLEQELEKFKKDVVWSRKYRILPGVSEIKLLGSIRFQICNTQCIPYSEPFEQTVVVTSNSESSALTSYSLSGRPAQGPVGLTVKLTPENALPGEEVELRVTMSLNEGWHVYSQDQEEGPGGTPTEFQLFAFQGLQSLDDNFAADQLPELKTSDLAESMTIEQSLYHKTVTWTRKFLVDESATEHGYGVQGSVIYQTCTEQKCLPPREVSFSLGELSAAQSIAELQPVETLDISNIISENRPEENSGSLPLYLMYAFLGGLILNVMPCVLPVLAIKILSFVKQAGEDRFRVLQLNIAYSIGVIAVFLLLASLAAFLEMGWGSLFQKSEFNIFMACLVFVMGLSLLGVFEIPIPGLAGGGTQKEGLMGAFLTGIFATFLATPCSGPLMGATLGWSVKQETHIIFLIWGVMGLGMASPYLLAGLFPSTIRWLPKPGPWMIRFKEISGFALMGAVIWIISYTGTDLILPVMVMMIGLAFGLWMVGNLYDATTHINHKNRVRFLATIITGGIVYYGISLMPERAGATGSPSNRVASEQAEGMKKPHPQEPANPKPQVEIPIAHGPNSLPWTTFSDSALQSALRQKKTVLVDFTADWCLICKQNERYSLNTPETLKLVQESGVVPLYADFTDESPYLKEWLKKFDSISVPLTVIFPGDNPGNYIVIRDRYSQSHLLEKLQEATSDNKTAMNQ